MSVGDGSAEIAVALLDGPVALSHPDLSNALIRVIGPGRSAHYEEKAPSSPACRHGTFIAGILSAAHSAETPGICPGCTLLVRPVFRDEPDGAEPPPATAEDVAGAIVEAVDAGARVINISGALHPSVTSERDLEDALTWAMRRGTLVIAAAGNHGSVASSSLTRHPGVLPVTACDAMGRPTPRANLAPSLGARGIAAPATARSIVPDGPPLTLSGTSFAAALVSGAAALLWSAAPHAHRQEIVKAVTGSQRRSSVMPPRLDAWTAYQRLLRIKAAA